MISLFMNSIYAMLRRLVYVYIILLSAFYANAQHNIDSLKSVLASSGEDTNRALCLDNLSWALMLNSRYKVADSFAKAALQLSEKLNYKAGIAYAYLDFGTIEQNTGNYDKGIKDLNNCIELEKEIGNKKGMAAAYTNVGNIYETQSNYAEAFKCQTEGLNLNREINSVKGMASNYANLGVLYEDQSNHTEALKNLMQAMNLDEKYNYKYALGTIYESMGAIYEKVSNYPEALQYEFKAEKITEETGNMAGLANAYGNIGNIDADISNYAEALKYQQLAVKTDSSIGNKEGEETDYMNLGNVYLALGNNKAALSKLFESLKLSEEIGDTRGLGYTYGNMGNIYTAMENYPEATNYFFKALAVDRQIGIPDGLAGDYTELAECQLKQKKYADARKSLDSSLTYAQAINSKDLIGDIYHRYAFLDSATGNDKSAFEAFKLYIVYKDSVSNDKNTKKLVSEQLQFEFDKKQAEEKTKQDRKDALAGADRKRQSIITASVIAVLILVLLFAGLLFSRFRITTKQKEIIEEQKIAVEEKNKEILDSITYAKRLQDAILPPLSIIEKHLPESFVLYKPKDIVAGDFYWLGTAPLNPPKGGSMGSITPPLEGLGEAVLIAAADCTGHGVPGAMVSVVCSNALNRTVREFKITEPGKILDKVRELVVETFAKSESEVKDGMDISIASITPSKGGILLSWAGAYNSLLYIENGEMKEWDGDKQPIGKTDNPKPFTTHTINIIPTTGGHRGAFYLFTDGYADQFGGPKGKKFKYKQLKETLSLIASQPMAEQKKKLEETFANWKGNLEQVDDILIIGLRV